MSLPIPEYQLLGGLIGAAASLLLIAILPYAYSLARKQSALSLTIGAVVGVVVILLGTLLLGVLSAVVAGSTDLKTAIVAGLAYQSTLAAGVAGARAAIG